MVALDPERGRAYTANIGSGSVSVLDLGKGTRDTNIATGDGAEGIAHRQGGPGLAAAPLVQGSGLGTVGGKAPRRQAHQQGGAVCGPARVQRVGVGAEQLVGAVAAFFGGTVLGYLRGCPIC